jgi:Golgi SNAP receptor complex protein 2
LKLQREESIHTTNRQELLGRRHATNTSSTPENPYDSINRTASDMTREQGMQREGDVLSRAGHQIDEFIEHGRMVLGDLGEQGDILKSAQKSIYSVANTLGVSNETIRLVERRALQDKWVFYGGIFVMLVCFYYILKWFG